MKLTIVKCPTCTNSVEWSAQSQWRPFCSERCRLIDLGEWFGEEHRIPSEETPLQINDDDLANDSLTSR